MITKQQALEFIYELSKEHKVVIDSKIGYIGIDPFVDIDGELYGEVQYSYGQRDFKNSIESAITQFIQSNINTDLFKNLDKIPVDVDMLEVGQTYKVEFLDFTGVSDSFTEKLLSITEEDKPVFNFSNGYYTKYIDIKEIYKVNEHANM